MPDHDAFDFRLRVLLCSQCGASISLPREGNVATCEFCGTQATIETTSARPPREPAEATDSLEASWRQQVEHPTEEQKRYVLDWPTDLDWTKKAPQEKAQEGFEEAFTAERVNPHADPHTHAMRLTVMACVLSNRYIFVKDPFSARAVLDTALMHVKDEGFRQVLNARMVRSAVFAGDTGGAEHWLGELDDRSPLLSLHNEYQAAKAFCAFGKGDMEGILAALGETDGALPTMKEVGSVFGVLRLHALDALGRLDEVEKEMRRLKDHYGVMEFYSALKTVAVAGVADSVLQRERRRGRTFMLVMALILASIIGLIVFLIL